MADTRWVTVSIPRGLDKWNVAATISSAIEPLLPRFGSGEFTVHLSAATDRGNASRDTLATLRTAVAELAGRLNHLTVVWHEVSAVHRSGMPLEDYKRELQSRVRKVHCNIGSDLMVHLEGPDPIELSGMATTVQNVATAVLRGHETRRDAPSPAASPETADDFRVRGWLTRLWRLASNNGILATAIGGLLTAAVIALLVWISRF